ncbi:hypothetical protein QEZ54_17760 [Catellatospora sp. KI3]|uniref:hypothetical protein n=1 Tax=Catellatospora sp. KI3 TaxID=3041620 RepID=UPI0024826793|nr:hypothetical protein [Catellatospora sp. KI3]MDI1462826.1 hypothetical protein [Catellatospora sp. KI3]
MAGFTGATRRRAAAWSTAGAALAAMLALTGPAAAHQAPDADAAGAAQTPCEPLTKFRPRNFRDSAEITNRFYPLVSGYEYTLQGFSDTGGGLQPHTVVLFVTDFVKDVAGVTTRVLWDVDTNDGVLAESELAFQAQDKDRNVWVLGEYPEEFDENGQFTGAPSTWITGQEDARGGVLVPGKPKKGKEFLEGYAPEIDFLDCGEVHRTHQDNVCTPNGCYDGVLVIDETSPLDEEGGVQRKFYAPGVGNVKITAIDDPEGETLVLVSKRKLPLAERLRADLEALKLEKRAYEISEVYRSTDPMQLDPSSPDVVKQKIVAAPSAH